VLDGPAQGRKERGGAGEHAVVLQRELADDRLGDARREVELVAPGHERVLHGHQDRDGHVDVGDPLTGVEAAELATGLRDVLGAATVQLADEPGQQPAHLLRHPVAQDAADAAGAELHGPAQEPFPPQARDDAQDQLEQAHRPPRVAVPPAGVERRAGGDQDEPADEVGVALPQQLCDRAAHREAGGDHRAGAEVTQQGRDVVGGVGEAERGGGAQPAPVAAVVHRQHPAVARQRAVAGEPGRVGGQHPAVQEHDRRCRAGGGAVAGGRPGVADEQLAHARHLDHAAGGQAGRGDRLLAHAGGAGAGRRPEDGGDPRQPAQRRECRQGEQQPPRPAHQEPEPPRLCHRGKATTGFRATDPPAVV